MLQYFQPKVTDLKTGQSYVTTNANANKNFLCFGDRSLCQFGINWKAINWEKRVTVWPTDENMGESVKFLFLTVKRYAFEKKINVIAMELIYP